jgi:hypothetical protein
MRLTVHLSEVEKQKIEVPVKGKPGTTVMKDFINNTLSFSDINLDQVGIILGEIESSGKKIASHHFSGDSRYGRARGKKK